MWAVEATHKGQGDMKIKREIVNDERRKLKSPDGGGGTREEEEWGVKQ